MICFFLVEYDALQRLGITDPKGFIKKRYKSEPLVYLSTCCAGPAIQDQIEASVEEALSNSSWVDILVSKAYPGSECVVPNSLAKWKKLEPNEIDFSQGFSQKVVSRSCSVFKSLPASGSFRHLLITFANSLDPDQARQNVGPDLDPNCLTP